MVEMINKRYDAMEKAWNALINMRTKEELEQEFLNAEYLYIHEDLLSYPNITDVTAMDIHYVRAMYEAYGYGRWVDFIEDGVIDSFNEYMSKSDHNIQQSALAMLGLKKFEEISSEW